MWTRMSKDRDEEARDLLRQHFTRAELLAIAQSDAWAEWLKAAAWEVLAEPDDVADASPFPPAETMTGTR